MSRVKLTEEMIEQIEDLLNQGLSNRKVAEQVLGSSTKESTIRNAINRGDIVKDEQLSIKDLRNIPKPKVLILDIENSPTKAAVWNLWNTNVGLNMIDKEWFILSYAAKWLGEDEVFYDDMRGVVHTEDDTHLLEQLWKLLDEADVVIGHNSKRFDTKKINARLIMKGFQPPSNYKQMDTLDIAKRKFAFTSNKLEWLSHHLNVDFKKLDHGNFAGYSLWKGMLDDNLDAWKECEEYNIYDTRSTEELYLKLSPWDDRTVNFNLYHHDSVHICNCGSTDVVRNGYAYTGKSKFQKWRCKNCGSETRDSINLFDKEKRKSLHLNVRD